MHESPRVSICIPSYNQIEYLPSAVRSALGQTAPSLEVVVSENHSTDGSMEYLHSLRDPRLRIVRPDRHLGMFENFDFCVRQSHGEFFNILSSDDVLLESYAETVAECLEANPNVAYTYCAVDLIDAAGARLGQGRHAGGSFVRSGRTEIKNYLRGPRPFLPSVMIRRSAYEEVGGFGNWKLIGDWNLYLRLLQIGGVAYHDAVLAQYRSWTTPQRASRQLMQLREVTALYASTTQSLVSRYPELRRPLKRAPRAQAIAFARGIHTLAGTNDFAEAEGLVRQLDNSAGMRLRLILGRRGLRLPLDLGQSGRTWLRQTVKRLLYT